ncbi:MAG: 2OG-Fe(II) oxygenase [Bacteriovoracaceae bacterium]
MKILSSELLSKGALELCYPLPHELLTLVKKEDWLSIDKLFFELTRPEAHLTKFLKQFHQFQSIEFTIAIRDSANPDEEDGIWHDDGSRFMAASLSLTLDQIEGGVLEVKEKGGKFHYHFPTPRYGNLILFLTGEYNILHKINRVTKGKRVIVVLWCS